MKQNISEVLNKTTIVQLTKFALVGCLNTGLSLAVFYALYNLFDIDKYLSNFIAYLIGLINSFFWNKLWVFRKSNSNILREALYFLVVFAISYGIQFVCFRMLVEHFHISANWAQILTAAIYTIANYILNRYITFKQNI